MIHAQILAAYRGADRFIRTEPAMPMPALDNVTTIGPLATQGRQCRPELDKRLALPPGERLVLVSMGGIGYRLPMEQWPVMPGWHFIVPHEWDVTRADCITFESLEIAFRDLLASCDLLITKPGYGAFSEAAINGVPVLYVPRNDWPESPWLIRWLEQYGQCAAIDREQLERGDVATAIAELFARGRPIPVKTRGVEQAVAAIEAVIARK